MKNIFKNITFILIFAICAQTPMQAAQENSGATSSWSKLKIITTTAAIVGTAIGVVWYKNRQRIKQANEDLDDAAKGYFDSEDDNLALAQTAIRNGADVNLTTHPNPSIIFDAIDSGQPRVVAALLQSRADVNAAIDRKLLINHSDTHWVSLAYKQIAHYNFFEASPMLVWAIIKEHNQHTFELPNPQKIHDHCAIVQSLLNHDAICPPTLATDMRPVVQKGTTFRKISLISDPVRKLLLDRLLPEERAEQLDKEDSLFAQAQEIEQSWKHQNDLDFDEVAANNDIIEV